MLIKSAENPSHFYHLIAVLVIKRVQRVLPKLQAKGAHSHTYRDVWHAKKKQKVWRVKFTKTKASVSIFVFYWAARQAQS